MVIISLPVFPPCGSEHENIEPTEQEDPSATLNKHTILPGADHGGSPEIVPAFPEAGEADEKKTPVLPGAVQHCFQEKRFHFQARICSLNV
ncbi:hypothetical protein GOB93_02365 [Acetobacter musti]|uniref:Uncharacterized protein n=1 Tax=Acetobacter musti TaxID=864732 RepID=A0ABX0JPC8_9PROT|nr:hypothetical protein [Acetobacter musti]NHN83484.1 hypothetical protein [Acetobacter musti]